MLLPSANLRRMLVVWLYAVASAHVFGSLVFAWAGFSGLSDGDLSILEQAFWTETVPTAAHASKEPLHV